MRYAQISFVVTLVTPFLLMSAPLTEEMQEVTLSPLSEEVPFLAEEFEIPNVDIEPHDPIRIELTSFPEEITLRINNALEEPEEPMLTAIEQEPRVTLEETESLSASAVESGVTEGNTLAVADLSSVGEPGHLTPNVINIDLKQAFRGSPVIYLILLSLSIGAVCLFLYSLASIRASIKVPTALSKQLQHQLMNNHFQEALHLCQGHNTLLPKMMQVALQSKNHGLPTIVESMKLEAKRSTVFFWQKVGLLNDVAIIAPMLGLLGTVLGMFYAFYDVNRSIESVSTLFDGLGVSVGTTVAGLVVAILALTLHSIAKYRLVRALAKVENDAQSLALLLDDKTHIHRG